GEQQQGDTAITTSAKVSKDNSIAQGLVQGDSDASGPDSDASLTTFLGELPHLQTSTNS
ncbi:hypothetical protein TorRG33x02_085420, partial [Trema orientale]